MTPTEEPMAGIAREAVGDRALWLELRKDAQRGRLQAEGFALVDRIHGDHPEWRLEWDL